MSSIAQRDQALGARASRPRTASRRSSAKPRVLGGGVVWIVLLAGLLAGVVAVNVAVLRLNVQLDETGRERSQLKADVASLRSELSSTSATSRIQRVAEDELGLVLADPDTVTYVHIPAR